MRKLYSVFVMMSSGLLLSAQVAVTLQVDMSNETVAAEGVHVAGSFQGWDPVATVMSDDDMDNVYEVTLDMEPGVHEFKFINGMSWDFVEDVPSACQVEVNGNDNRFLNIDSMDTESMMHACFASCAACGMTTVRFRVDMTVESAVSPNGVHVAGEFQDWDPAADGLSDPDGNGIWELITSFDASALDGILVYKFINGNAWTNPNENLTGEECADDFGNRVMALESENLVLYGDETTGAAPCYNGCGTCVAPTDVTFRVDMTTQESVSVNGVHVAGSFQGWSPSTNPLFDDDGDGIWEATYGIASGDIQFKFINGNDWSGGGEGNVDNELIVGDCAAEGSDNRALTIGTEAIVYEVCYNSCALECVENPDPADITFRVDMSEEDVNANGVWAIGNFTTPNWQSGGVQLTDDNVDGVYELTVNISGGSTVLYKFVNGDPTSGDNGVDYWEESGVQLDADNEEITNFEIDGCGLANGFGAYNRIHERNGTAEILESVCFNKCSTCVVGVDEIMAASLEAYPNPTKHTLTVSWAPLNQQVTLRLLDLTGRSIRTLEQNGLNSQLELDMSDQADGVYVLEFLAEDMRQSVRIIKE